MNPCIAWSRRWRWRSAAVAQTSNGSVPAGVQIQCERLLTWPPCCHWCYRTQSRSVARNLGFNARNCCLRNFLHESRGRRREETPSELGVARAFSRGRYCSRVLGANSRFGQIPNPVSILPRVGTMGFADASAVPDFLRSKFKSGPSRRPAIVILKSGC